jgi:hypothetical protein
VAGTLLDSPSSTTTPSLPASPPTAGAAASHEPEGDSQPWKVGTEVACVSN